TRVTACTLAESPCDPLHRELRQLCCLRCRLDCYRVERTSSRAGVAPAEVQRLSRRTFSPITCQRPAVFSRLAATTYTGFRSIGGKWSCFADVCLCLWISFAYAS